MEHFYENYITMTSGHKLAAYRIEMKLPKHTYTFRMTFREN